MRSPLFPLVFVMLTVLRAAPEDGSGAKDAPIYRVTVVQRTLPAVNYGHRTAPTRIDFRGTVLDAGARGSAVVEAKPGAVMIQAKFERLGSPAKFGAQYLTYVLWAISPEGQAERLGEIVTNHRDETKLVVTSSLQTFGLLVTAEPYFAVSRPGPVVVMENVLRRDTAGTPEPIAARYELMQRPQNYEINLSEVPPDAGGRMVTQREYEVVLALYQARNAIQIAKAEGVDTYAHDTLRRAEELTQQAEKLPDTKANRDRIVMLARQAVQTVEDARSIARQKTNGDK